MYNEERRDIKKKEIKRNERSTERKGGRKAMEG